MRLFWDLIQIFIDIWYTREKLECRRFRRMSNWFSEPMENEVPYSEIEAKSGSFHKWNFEPLTMQEIGYEGVNDKLREYTAERYEALDDEGKEKLVKEVLDIYRSVDLLPIQYYSEIGVMNEIEKCINYKAGFTGNTVSCVSGDTEFFNGKIWKRIDQYEQGDKVLQYNPVTKEGELVDPIKYIHKQDDEAFYEVKGSADTMVVSENHDVVYADDETGELKKAKTKDLFREISDDEANVVQIPVCCVIKDSEYSVHEDEDTLCSIANGVSLNKVTSDYLKLDENGNVFFDEKVFNLDYESRKTLLTLLRVGVDVYVNMRTGKLAKQACMLWNMTYTVGMITTSESDEYFGCEGIENTYVLKNSDGYTGKEGLLDCIEYYRDWKDDYKVITSEDEVSYGYNFFDKYCFEVPSHMLYLRRGDTCFVTGNCGAGVGTTLCNYLFPNLFDVPSKHDLDKKDAETLFKKFHNDAYLSRAIKFCFSYKNGCPTPTNVMGGLRLVGSAPTNFRPMNAKAVYERFCPEGGTVYDFCCGFGGRLLGCLSSKKNFRYVGTDPCVETMYHLHELGDYIEMVTGRDDSYELHCCGSEDFRGPAESVDFAFSSPPYFDLEVYSTDETQCFNKFPELDQWLEGYVRATIKNIKHMLRRGCVYAVNIADFTVGGGNTVAYVDEWIRISTEEGMPLYDTVYLGVTARAGSAQQAAGELKKENILIFKKPL